MKFIVHLLLSAVAVLAAAYIVPGVHIDWFMWALIVAVVLAVVNATLGAFLKTITAPLNWLTIGLIGLIINVLMVLVVDHFVDGFSTGGFWASAIFAFVLCVIQTAFGVKKK